MLFRNTKFRYGWLARIMHWSSVILVGALFIDIAGLDVPPKLARRDEVVDLHVSLGLVLLVLMFVRMVWRWLNPNPLLSFQLSRGRFLFALSIHRTIYLLVLLECLCGLLWGLANTSQISLFSLTIVQPTWVAAWSVDAAAWHSSLAIYLLILIGIHAAAAILNQVAAKPTQD